MIAAVVVLYNPDLVALDRSLEILSGQVHHIAVVDNTPIPKPELHFLIEKLGSRVQYRWLGGNRGLAAAQNAGIVECCLTGYTHFLFLDQDSVPSFNLVSKLLCAEHTLTRSGIKVGVVGPLFDDIKSRKVSYAIRYRWFRAEKVFITKPEDGPVETDWVISSGSLIRSSVLEEVGMMREDLFMDWIDAEWGLRAQRSGFHNYVIPEAKMDHSIGDQSRGMLGWSFSLHNYLRNYYIVRNATYLLRPNTMNWRWATAMILRIPKHIAVHTWYSENRFRGLRSMLTGLADGIRGKLGPSAEQF